MTKEQLEKKQLYSINKLSLELNVDRRTLKRHLLHESPDYTKGKQNYYSLTRVEEILEEQQGEGSDKQQLECRKILAQIENLNLRNAELEGKTVSVAEVNRLWSLHIQTARTHLIELENVASLVAGKSVNDTKQIIREHVTKVIKALNECPTYGEPTEDIK